MRRRIPDLMRGDTLWVCRRGHLLDYEPSNTYDRRCDHLVPAGAAKADRHCNCICRRLPKTRHWKQVWGALLVGGAPAAVLAFNAVINTGPGKPLKDIF